MVTATIKVMGKKFSSEGETVQEALMNLKPGNVGGTTVLTVTNGDSTIERVLPTIVARRAFNLAGISKEAAIKNISLMFK